MKTEDETKYSCYECLYFNTKEDSCALGLKKKECDEVEENINVGFNIEETLQFRE